jgi:hypothetical protein
MQDQYADSFCGTIVGRRFFSAVERGGKDLRYRIDGAIIVVAAAACRERAQDKQ